MATEKKTAKKAPSTAGASLKKANDVPKKTAMKFDDDPPGKKTAKKLEEDPPGKKTAKKLPKKAAVAPKKTTKKK